MGWEGAALVRCFDKAAASHASHNEVTVPSTHTHIATRSHDLRRSPSNDSMYTIVVKNVHTTHGRQTRPRNVLVPIAEAAKLLLTSRVPALEDDGPEVRVEAQRVHLHANRGDILLLELPRKMALHKRCLSDATIAHKDELELGRRVPSGRSGGLIMGIRGKNRGGKKRSITAQQIPQR